MSALQDIATKAAELSAAGKHAEAAAKYDEILKMNDGIAEVHLNKGVSLNAAGKPEEALSAFLRAIELKPELASAYVNAGNVYKNLGKLDKAEQSFRDALDRDGNMLQAWSNLVHILNQAGKFTQASEAAAEAITAMGGKVVPSLHNERIFAFFNLNRPEDSVDDVEAILSATPMEKLPQQQRELYALVLSQVGSRLLQQGKPQDALEYLERGAEGDSSSGNLFPYGMCLVQLERNEEAVPILQKALDLDGANWRIAIALGTLHMRKQAWQEAADLFEQGMKAREAAQDPYVNFNYAVCLMNLGRDSEAREPLELVVSMEPDNAVALALLGTLCINDEDYEGAIQALERAATLQGEDTKDGSVNYNLGYARLMADKPVEALEAFELAAKINPTNEQVSVAIQALQPETMKKERLTKEEIEEAVNAQQLRSPGSGDKRASRREIVKDVMDARTPLERAQSLLQPQRPAYLRRKSMEGIQKGMVKALASAYEDITSQNKHSGFKKSYK